MIQHAPPPIPWRIEGLAVDGALTILAGREGRGKSLFALSLAIGVGRGASVAGFACRSGRALIIDVENGEHEAHRRVHALRAQPDRLSYCVEDVDLRRHLGLIEELIQRVKPDLVILDSFRPLAPGVDENDSGAVDSVLAPLRNLAHELNVAIILLHHAGKQGGTEYRGSTAIGAAAELGFTLTGGNDADPTRTLTCWKSRPAPKPAPRSLAIRQTKDGRPEVVAAGAGAPDQPISRSRVRHEAIVSELGSGPKTRKALAEALGERPDQPSGGFRRVLQHLIDGGRVKRVAHGVYALAEVDESADGQEAS